MAELDDNDILIALEGYILRHSLFVSTMVINYEYADKDCKLPEGSTKRLIERAADLAGWQIQIAGATTAKLIRKRR